MRAYVGVYRAMRHALVGILSTFLILVLSCEAMAERRVAHGSDSHDRRTDDPGRNNLAIFLCHRNKLQNQEHDQKLCVVTIFTGIN